MKIPNWFLSGLLGGAILLESWTLRELVNLKIEVARLSDRVAEFQGQKFTGNSQIINSPLAGR